MGDDAATLVGRCVLAHLVVPVGGAFQSGHLVRGLFWWNVLFLFIFNFLNNILSLTRLPFYLQDIARLVAPASVA